MYGLRAIVQMVACLAAPLVASAQPAPTVVIVVRHAEKGPVPRLDPPLTAAGVARAGALAGALADANVRAIITTQLVRTVETARPLAERLGLVPEVVRRGANPVAHARAVAAAVRRHAGQTILVVGHGETVGPIIAALGGPKLPRLCANEYSHLFVLVVNNGSTRLVKSDYGAPAPPSTDGCVPQ